MASYQLISSLGVYTLEAGMTVTVEAIDPETGAAVTGVTVSSVAIYASNSFPTLIGVEDVDHAYTFEGTE